MPSVRPHQRLTAFDRMLAPLHRCVWSDAGRRIQKLFRFGETETDGGRDILRAAEVTPILCYAACIWSTRLTSFVTAFCSVAGRPRS